MDLPRVPKTFAFLVTFVALLVLLVLARPLLPIDETRYLAVAWEMRLSGDIFHLTRNFESYAHKPPLLFWLINAVWLVAGVSEIAARFVGPACAVAAVVATGGLARRLWPDDAQIALRAMVALASFSAFAVYGSAVMFDALQAVIVVLAIGLLWRIGQGRDERRLWLWLGVALGAGVLAKGPVMLVHVLPALLAMPLWAGHPPPARRLLRGTGLALLVALGVVALWLVPALATGDGAFRRELLWTQTAARVTGDMGHPRPIWFLLALLPCCSSPGAGRGGSGRTAPARRAATGRCGFAWSGWGRRS